MHTAAVGQFIRAVTNHRKYFKIYVEHIREPLMICTATNLPSLGIDVDSGGKRSDGMQLSAFFLGFCALFQQ